MAVDPSALTPWPPPSGLAALAAGMWSSWRGLDPLPTVDQVAAQLGEPLEPQPHSGMFAGSPTVFRRYSITADAPLISVWFEGDIAVGVEIDDPHRSLMDDRSDLRTRSSIRRSASSGNSTSTATMAWYCMSGPTTTARSRHACCTGCRHSISRHSARIPCGGPAGANGSGADPLSHGFQPSCRRKLSVVNTSACMSLGHAVADRPALWSS